MEVVLAVLGIMVSAIGSLIVLIGGGLAWLIAKSFILGFVVVLCIGAAIFIGINAYRLGAWFRGDKDKPKMSLAARLASLIRWVSMHTWNGVWDFIGNLFRWHWPEKLMFKEHHFTGSKSAPEATTPAIPAPKAEATKTPEGGGGF